MKDCRVTYQSMRIGWETSWAWSRIWSRCSESLMGSMSTAVGLVISGQNASTLKSLFEILLQHLPLFLLSNQLQHPEVVCNNEQPAPPPLHNCCWCWSMWWYWYTSLYKMWEFTPKVDIFLLFLTCARKKITENWRKSDIVWWVRRKSFQENHVLGNWRKSIRSHFWRVWDKRKVAFFWF